MNARTNEQRERQSDQRMKPTVWYVYILDLGDGFYVGQTNDLEARLIEHGTNGRSAQLVWFNQVTDREAAKTMEKRLQRTLDNGKDSIVRLVGQFDRLMRLMRPEKSLLDLEREHREHEAYSRNAMHHIPVSVGHRRTACGESFALEGYDKYGTGELDDLKRDEEIYQTVLEATGDGAAALRAAPYRRSSCRYCLHGERSPLAVAGENPNESLTT